jgi:hypothetical protein
VADEADRAQDSIDFAMKMAVDKMKNSPGLRPVGLCYYCGEEVKGDLRFCDKDCLSDWQHEQNCRARSGHSA